MVYILLIYKKNAHKQVISKPFDGFEPETSARLRVPVSNQQHSDYAPLRNRYVTDRLRIVAHLRAISSNSVKADTKAADGS